MMKYAYYPGCSLDSTGIEFNLSTQAVCKAWGMSCGRSPTGIAVVPPVLM